MRRGEFLGLLLAPFAARLWTQFRIDELPDDTFVENGDFARNPNWVVGGGWQLRRGYEELRYNAKRTT